MIQSSVSVSCERIDAFCLKFIFNIYQYHHYLQSQYCIGIYHVLVLHFITKLHDTDLWKMCITEDYL
jgi:hypothetical protein